MAKQDERKNAAKARKAGETTGEAMKSKEKREKAQEARKAGEIIAKQ